jgi:hypothetical protein
MHAAQPTQDPSFTSDRRRFPRKHHLLSKVCFLKPLPFEVFRSRIYRGVNLFVVSIKQNWAMIRFNELQILECCARMHGDPRTIGHRLSQPLQKSRASSSSYSDLAAAAARFLPTPPTPPSMPRSLRRTSSPADLALLSVSSIQFFPSSPHLPLDAGLGFLNQVRLLCKFWITRSIQCKSSMPNHIWM